VSNHAERWELIDHNPVTGLRKWMGYDQDTDSVLVSYDQDKAVIDAALDRNKECQNETQHGDKDMWHAAHVPVQVMYEWLAKHGVNAWDPSHIDGVKRLLNSNEYRWCRVRNFIM